MHIYHPVRRLLKNDGRDYHDEILAQAVRRADFEAGFCFDGHDLHRRLGHATSVSVIPCGEHFHFAVHCPGYDFFAPGCYRDSTDAVDAAFLLLDSTLSPDEFASLLAADPA